jgi:homoserine kinase type II
MYEFRIDLDDLPYFLSLLDHLAAKGCPVPRTIHARDGRLYQVRDAKALALIEFLPGVSVADPTPAQARAVGAALAQLHLAAADFPQTRANGMDRANGNGCWTPAGMTALPRSIPCWRTWWEALPGSPRNGLKACPGDPCRPVPRQRADAG